MAKREARRDVPRRVNRNAVTSSITAFEGFPVKPLDVVTKIVPEIAARDESRFKDFLEHARHVVAVVLKRRVLLSIPLNLPMVGPHHWDKPMRGCEANDIGDLMTIEFADDAGNCASATATRSRSTIL